MTGAATGRLRTWLNAAASAARGSLRGQIAIAFGDDPDGPTTDHLARFALAAIDGAVVAVQTDHGVTLGWLLQPLVPSLVASRQAMPAKADGPAGQAGE